MKNIKVLAVLNGLCFLVHLMLSQLTQFEVLNDQTIGDVSAKYPTLFTPAGITFAIWGLIYLALTAFCLYHLVKAFGADENQPANQDLRQLGYLFMLNNLATGAWTLAWVYEYLLLSVLLMLVQLGTLILMQVKLGIFNPGRSVASRWLTQFPLSIYFGWICIATVANISAALVGWGWQAAGSTPALWTLIMIAAATGITIFVVLNRRNPYVGLVTMWAFYGIILKHQSLNLAVSSGIIFTAWIGLALVAFMVLYQIYQNIKSSSQPKQTLRP